MGLLGPAGLGKKVKQTVEDAGDYVSPIQNPEKYKDIVSPINSAGKIAKGVKSALTGRALGKLPTSREMASGDAQRHMTKSSGQASYINVSESIYRLTGVEPKMYIITLTK